MGYLIPDIYIERERDIYIYIGIREYKGTLLLTLQAPALLQFWNVE